MRSGFRFQHYPLLAIMLVCSLAVLAACGDDDDPADDIVDDSEIESIEPTEPADESEETPAPADDPEPVDEDEDTEPADTTASSERLEELDLDLELVVEGFVSPTDMVPATDGTDRLFVVSRPGMIQVIENGELREEPLLDIYDQVEHEMVEQGMLGIALHPDFAENGYLYVNYINDGDENTIISRFEMTEDSERLEPESESVILEVEQPHYSHNGGNIKFGPDGYLYIGLGDGEDPGDPHENSQDAGEMLGSILRIDVDADEPYGIPEDNPFVGTDDGLDEVWAYGLRNPWRFSFDDVTGDMFMVDVGQWDVEEVNVQPADSPGGENYGWPIMEGDECWEADECDKEGFTMPVATYTNPDMGCAIIGGFTYHGDAHPDLEGIYFFGDWCSGLIWGLVEEDGEWKQEVVIESDLMINAFGLDHDGEIYVLDFEEGGGVYRITSN